MSKSLTSNEIIDEFNDQINVIEFVNKLSPYWPQLFEQLVPSTTLWTGGNLIENNIFGRPKYPYRYSISLPFATSTSPSPAEPIREASEKSSFVLWKSENFLIILDI